MSVSNVSISNLALAKLGAESFRSFDENNTRVRTCEATFEPTRDEVLESYDWAFARRIKKLHRDLSVESDVGESYFKIPGDCIVPRDVYPWGSKESWELRGRHIVVSTSQETLTLKYTAKETNCSIYSPGFVMCLAHRMVVYMSVSLTRNKDLAGTLEKQYVSLHAKVTAEDANTGSEYLAPDQRPQQDAFVNPTGQSWLALQNYESGD